MDAEFEAIKKALVDYPPSGDEKSFIDIFVIGRVTEENVRDVMKLMSQNAELNRAFWSTINKAPTTDDGWRSIFWIGSDMSDEQQNRSRNRLRITVEVVRRSLGAQQVHRTSLFRNKP